MDGIENIMYVVIGIGWFLWNMYRKMQAGKEQPTKRAQRPKPVSSAPANPHREPEPFKSLEDMIMEQLGGEKEVQPAYSEPVHENQDKFLSSDLTHSHLPDNYQMSADESKSHRVERQVRKLELEEEEYESVKNLVMPDGFDLQQAVVLNAVLNRPYA